MGNECKVDGMVKFFWIMAPIGQVFIQDNVRIVSKLAFKMKISVYIYRNQKKKVVKIGAPCS